MEMRDEIYRTIYSVRHSAPNLLATFSRSMHKKCANAKMSHFIPTPFVETDAFHLAC